PPDLAAHLFGPDTCATGAADQSGPRSRPAGGALAAADGAGTCVPDAGAAGDAGLPVTATARPGRSAEHAILPQQFARPAVAARPQRRQPGQRTQPRNPAAAEPAGTALKPDH